MLAVELATRAAQWSFSMNTEISYIHATITEARIKALEDELQKLTFPDPAWGSKWTPEEREERAEFFRKEYYQKMGWKYIPRRK